VAIIAEIGIDMTVFGNAKRLAAWACPGNHESAGKKGSVRFQGKQCSEHTPDHYKLY